MKKIVFLIFSALLLSSANPATAQETASSSGSPTLEETGKAVKERIRKWSEQNSEKIKGTIDQLSQQKRGFIGQVERVTKESLTITNNKGTEIIPIDEQITLLKANQKISIDDIAVDDWLVVMGLVIDDVFTPKRILVSTKSLRPKHHLVILGTITGQSPTTITILSRQNQEINLKINTQTNYQDQNGDTVLSSDFIEDIQVLVVGNESQNTKTASLIRSLVSLEALQDNE